MQEGEGRQKFIVKLFDGDFKAEMAAKISLICRRAYLPVLIALVGLASFFIGRSSVTQTESVKIVGDGYLEFASKYEIKDGLKADLVEAQVPGFTPKEQLNSDGEVIASKGGTKYYLPWCSGASRIKPENVVRFDSPQKARAAGYMPASNCKGIR